MMKSERPTLQSDPAAARWAIPATENTTPDLNDPVILEVANMLVREATDPGYRNATLIEGLSYALAMRIIQSVSGHRTLIGHQAANTPEDRIKRVLEYIEAHLGDSALSLAELASVAHLSPHQFARLFKSFTGRTPHQFIVNQRIALAKLMMLSGGKSLSEIAYSCGFANQAHFTTRFRDIAGETPNAFRARMEQGKSNG